MTVDAPAEKTCFVVMGFGKKTDFQAQPQRMLDLDKTYGVIKRAVEEAGLVCVRADDVVHSQVIDKPMYELLLEADVVIADLSTSNANAIYELGVRHALRPNTTIVIAESGFTFPFDLGHLLVRKYEHLGSGIDYDEAERLKAELAEAIGILLEKGDVDSPVYTFLHSLNPPWVGDAPAEPTPERAAAPDAPAPVTDEKFSVLLDSFHEARSDQDWTGAKVFLSRLLAMRPGDPYLVQQLALATYYSGAPDHMAALEEAKRLLEGIGGCDSQDAETLGLWGAVHKRIWQENDDPTALTEAIRAYRRGFSLRTDSYNGINYAFLLNARSKLSSPPEAIADFVTAQRVRRRVIDLCEEQLEAAPADDDAERIFLLATLVEALVGVGDDDRAAEVHTQLVAEAPDHWGSQTATKQLATLRELLEDSPLRFISS